MSDSETDSPSIKALIVFRENGETDNLFVPILCDAIRMAGINVRYSTKRILGIGYDIMTSSISNGRKNWWDGHAKTPTSSAA